MPITLQTLFCLPQDVWDLLSIEGVDLREDDHNLASGQIIQTTADTPVGSTTMAVAALPVAMLSGAWLTFDGAGMAVPAQVQLSAVANIGATSLLLVATTADVASGAQARDSGVNAATGARLLVGCRKGTSKVKLYCNQRYDDSQLVLSGSVCDWSATIAAKYLCTRRAQGCPKGLMADYEDVLRELQKVQVGQLTIENCGTRGVDWPVITNVTVDPAYDYMRARVEPNISEQTPTAYSQFIDWSSAMWLEL
jgi:hypothetical protein